jgi:hypothetical protein
LARGMNWSRSKILGLFHWGVDANPKSEKWMYGLRFRSD